MRSWSVSSVRQFHGCQLAWWFKRTGVEPDFKPLALVEGIVLHAALAHHLRGLRDGAAPPLEESLDLVEAELFAQECSGEIRYGRQDRDSALERLQALFRHWLEHGVPGGEVVAVEEELRVDLPGIDLPLLAFVDLVVRDDDGLHVIDFKVTAARPWVDELLDPLDLQKLALTRGWETLHGEHVARWTWQHLVKTRSPQVVDHGLPVEGERRDAELERLACVVVPTIQTMQMVLAGELSPVPTQGFGRMCQGCPWRRACSNA